MSELVEKKRSAKDVSRQDIDETLDRLFEAVTRAVNESTRRKVTLETVDRTLDALFDSINQAQTKGKKAKIPDFDSLIGTRETPDE